MGFCNIEGFDKRPHLKRITKEYYKEHGDIGFITNIRESLKGYIEEIIKEVPDIFIGKAWDTNGNNIDRYIGVYYSGDKEKADNTLRNFWEILNNCEGLLMI